MSELAQLSEVTLRPREDVIADLRQLLAHAESGHLRAFAITALYSNSEFAEGFAGLEEAGLINLIGSVTVLLHRLMRRVAYPPDETCGIPPSQD